MKIGRAETENGSFYGVFTDNGNLFIPLADSFEDLLLILAEKRWNDDYPDRNFKATQSFRFLPPVQPGKIIAIGLNYRDHAEEFGQPIPEEPLIFFKASSAITGHDSKIIIPEDAVQVDYEGELVIVIGKKAKKVAAEEAKNYILGYACGNDVTERYYQKKDGQWARAKSFDTFAPVGPWIETDPGNLDDLQIRTSLNGKIVQNSTFSNMIFKPDFLVSFISHIMTLYPGDMIFTGTPSGVGKLNPGDKVEVIIEGIGTLSNTVSSD